MQKTFRMFYELDPCSFFLSLYFKSGTPQNVVNPLRLRVWDSTGSLRKHDGRTAAAAAAATATAVKASPKKWLRALRNFYEIIPTRLPCQIVANSPAKYRAAPSLDCLQVAIAKIKLTDYVTNIGVIFDFICFSLNNIKLENYKVSQYRNYQELSARFCDFQVR